MTSSRTGKGPEMAARKEPEIEIIDRQEEENGDYSFTFTMTFPVQEDDE